MAHSEQFKALLVIVVGKRWHASTYRPEVRFPHTTLREVIARTPHKKRLRL
jgi:hypothetical protein